MHFMDFSAWMLTVQNYLKWHLGEKFIWGELSGRSLFVLVLQEFHRNPSLTKEHSGILDRPLLTAQSIVQIYHIYAPYLNVFPPYERFYLCSQLIGMDRKIIPRHIAMKRCFGCWAIEIEEMHHRSPLNDCGLTSRLKYFLMIYSF